MTVDALNAMDRLAAIGQLRRCCGSTRWAESMADRRPFADVPTVLQVADAIWASLDRNDWFEAFAAHPRIGADPAGVSKWSRDEQAGVSDTARRRFTEMNREYEARYGRTFIVCATGKSGGEMLSDLERRMRNTADEELREAAEEQRKITRLRLAKLTA